MSARDRKDVEASLERKGFEPGRAPPPLFCLLDPWWEEDGDSYTDKSRFKP